MSQSSVIAGVFLAAFILWLAVNNRLNTYTAVLWGPTAAPKPTGSVSSTGGSPILPGAPLPGSGTIGGTGGTPSLPSGNGIGGSALDSIGNAGEIAGLLEFIP